MSVIAFITDPGKGGHFLNWSVLYLSGRDTYFSCYSQTEEKLPHNPIIKANAHGFTANQPETIDDFYKVINIIEETDTFHTIYFHNFRGSTPEKDLGTGTAIKHIQSLANVKTVVLSNQVDHSLYGCKYAIRAIDTAEATDNHHINFINLFFKDSLDTWERLNLKDVWDQREFLALNLRPHHVLRIEPTITNCNGEYFLDTFDLYTCFDLTVHNLFKFLKLEIDNSRWASWMEVYRQWQELHKERMLFVWYYSIIITAILDGRDMDLERFKLDIIQEAAIQHTLIYQHSLNLKTWQLTKFTNTQQLHNLLEPNTHTLIC